MNSLCQILLAAALLLARCDERAAGSLTEMLAKIHSEEFENNFFDGEVFLTAPANEKEESAGCILDKV